MTKGIEFDPGFGPHILAFQGTVEYMYMDITRFKNLSQRKMKFMQYYKKMLQVFYNNLGFYVGCLMWASYIKTQEEQEILGNNFLGAEYNEDENTAEVDYMINFAELFPKDMKYFLSQNFEFEQKVMNILNTYKEFLILNKGFVETKNNTDIKLPANVRQDDAKNYKEKIDSVIKDGRLEKLLEFNIC